MLATQYGVADDIGVTCLNYCFTQFASASEKRQGMVLGAQAPGALTTQ